MKSFTLMAAALVAASVFSFSSAEAFDPIAGAKEVKLVYPGDFLLTCKGVEMYVDQKGNAKIKARCEKKIGMGQFEENELDISHKKIGDTIQNCNGKLTFTEKCPESK